MLARSRWVQWRCGVVEDAGGRASLRGICWSLTHSRFLAAGDAGCALAGGKVHRPLSSGAGGARGIAPMGGMREAGVVRP